MSTDGKKQVSASDFFLIRLHRHLNVTKVSRNPLACWMKDYGRVDGGRAERKLPATNTSTGGGLPGRARKRGKSRGDLVLVSR